jgi:hypothetical protein
MAAHLRGVGFPLALFLGSSILCWSLPSTRGQEPANQNAAPAASDSPSQRAKTAYLGVPDHIQPQAFQPQRRRSIVHHYPYPYPSYYNNDETAGFRNPGGVGKYAEYYPPGNQFQVQGGDPVRVAQFGVGSGYPSRGEQMQAQQIGISRYNSIQNHIDNYARPCFGFGFGAGGFGGFW